MFLGGPAGAAFQAEFGMGLKFVGATVPFPSDDDDVLRGGK
jgi:hypothetical protein